MIDLQSAIGNQQEIERARPADLAGKRHDEFLKVAKEMESLFAYQLLKVMRETAESMSVDKKGAGYNTYMSLFDMEVSKLFADRGLGLQDAIVNWLERMPEINNGNNNISS